MQLPPKRVFGWTSKPLNSAKTTVTNLPTDQIELTIAHDTIKGVTTEMLMWWFSTFTELKVKISGGTYPAYHVWHPFDHIEAAAIKTEADRPMKQGDKIWIHEAFQRDGRFEVDETAVVSTLDAGGMGLTAYKLGQTLLDLQHRFQDVEGGVDYRSRMVLGMESGLLKPLINNIVLPKRFSREKADAWLLHNVEEVGYFEYFLADLYDRRDQGGIISLD